MTILNTYCIRCFKVVKRTPSLSDMVELGGNGLVDWKEKQPIAVLCKRCYLGLIRRS